MARRYPGCAQHTRVWDVQRDRTNDCAHGIQPVATFGLAIVGRAARADDHLSASPGIATEWQRAAGCPGSGKLDGDEHRVSSHGAVLRARSEEHTSELQ